MGSNLKLSKVIVFREKALFTLLIIYYSTVLYIVIKRQGTKNVPIFNIQYTKVNAVLNKTKSTFYIRLLRTFEKEK